MRLLIKGTLTLVLLSSFFATCLLFLPLRLVAPWAARRGIAQTLQFFCRVALKIFGVEHHVTNLHQGTLSREHANLCLSNHLSYLDIIILASLRPLCFVSTEEVKQNWFLGPITMVAGCLYVERRKRLNHASEVRQLSEALKNGLSVLFFPEATSTNGESVLRFRGLLFRAAIDAEVPVKPYCLNYLKVNEEPFLASNRDKICWYGDMDFAPHFLEFLQQDIILVEVVDLPSIPVNAATNKKQLIEEAYAQVSCHFRPILGSTLLVPSDQVLTVVAE